MSAQGETETVLVCFAVKEEARFFRPPDGANLQILVTGIGPRNAEKAIRTALTKARPRLVLSCGFAGALQPGLDTSTVLFEIDGQEHVAAALAAAGARSARFHSIGKVATTANEKSALRQATGADAVEMESQIICAVCREKSIPCATLRVILDEAQEDLPLDFNLLMTSEQEMDYGKLALALFKSPGKVGALRKLQKQSEAAAKSLAEVLSQALNA